MFITNIRPQALRRLGLGPEDVAAVNSRLVHLNAQGFRSDSELGGHAAYGDIVQAASGLVWLNEQVSGVPYFVPTVVADKICGLVIVQSVLAALHHRDRTGQGQHIEVPMADTMLAFNLVEHLAAATLDPPQGPMGYSRALSSRRKAATTADGRMCILPYSDRNWRDFFTFVGRPELADDPRFGSLAERARNADELYALMEEFSPAHQRRMAGVLRFGRHPGSPGAEPGRGRRQRLRHPRRPAADGRAPHRGHLPPHRPARALPHHPHRPAPALPPDRRAHRGGLRRDRLPPSA